MLIIDDFARALHHNNQVDVGILDMSKAFDKVPHERLALNYIIVHDIQSAISDDCLIYRHISSPADQYTIPLETCKEAIGYIRSYKYRMAQNFDSGKY